MSIKFLHHRDGKSALKNQTQVNNQVLNNPTCPPSWIWSYGEKNPWFDLHKILHWGDIRDVITDANLGDDWLSHFCVARGQILGFSIGFHSRPYNTYNSDYSTVQCACVLLMLLCWMFVVWQNLNVKQHCLIHEGWLKWKLIGRSKLIKVYAALFSDVILLMQSRQVDNKLVLHCHSTTLVTGQNDTKILYIPVIRVRDLLIRTNATGQLQQFKI